MVFTSDSLKLLLNICKFRNLFSSDKIFYQFKEGFCNSRDTFDWNIKITYS